MAKEQANKKDNKDKKDSKNFFKEFKAELKRVSWPTFKQLVNNTAIVIGIVILVATIVFILDVIFENLNKFGVEKLKTLVTSSSSDETDAEQNDEESSNELIEDTTSEDTESEAGEIEEPVGENETNEIDNSGVEEGIELTSTEDATATETNN